MNRRLSIPVCFALVAVICLVAVNASTTTRADTTLNSWLDRTIEHTKRQDLSEDEFSKRFGQQVDCVMQKTEEWAPTPAWVWYPPKVWVSNENCVDPGATGYYGEDNTSSFVLPYGSTRIQRLSDSSGNYVRSTDQLTQQIPNTDKLLVVTNLWGQWHNPGLRYLKVVNNWSETYPASSGLTALGNPQRTMAKDYDYTLNDNGQPIENVNLGGIATSASGEWMHALVRQKAYILLNTHTHEVIPYAEANDPQYRLQVAVSNDGRFVAKNYEL